MIRINDIIDKVQDYNPSADIGIINKAYIFSAKAHEGQKRLSGEPYLAHPLEVANILADMRLDVESIAAGLLHDVLEDTNTSEKDFRKTFGDNIYHIVAGVTKISSSILSHKDIRNVESLRKMFLAMAEDLRVILIKLADRLHNMQTLQFHSSEDKQIAIARETLDIYAPIATRLGIFSIKDALEDIAFKFLYPTEYLDIKKLLLSKEQQDRENYISQMQKILNDLLVQSNIKGVVKGRYKTPYSIYKKKISQELSYEEIYDIIAFRIVVPSIGDCYSILGLVHNIWQPIEGKLKDYIGSPKPNGYRSLHTTVIGHQKQRVEIQIRTEEMDYVAESGIAAHWAYKEDGKINEKISQQYAWIRRSIETQSEISSIELEEFMDNTKIDLSPDEVHIYTPKGDTRSLPKGATPIDYAFTIHSDLGLSCYGAKVNGKIVPLSYQLKNSDVIEIITSKNHHPSKNWLNFVKTPKAKARIRVWLRTQEKEQSLALGKNICEQEFAKEGLDLIKILKSEKDKNKILETFNFKTLDSFFENIAYGKITPLQVVRRVFPLNYVKQEKPIPKEKTLEDPSKRGIVVGGYDDILIKIAKCCAPLPEDKIVGFMSQGAGVIIHSADCPNLQYVDPSRIYDAFWSDSATKIRKAYVQIKANDKTGLLAEITQTISNQKVDIDRIKTATVKDKVAIINLVINVKDSKELKMLILALRKNSSVISAKRVLEH